MNSSFNPEYEFLKDIYDENPHLLNISPIYEEAYEKEGKIIKINSGSIYINIGDWRPVIREKYPYLIFLTCFKLSDTIVEELIIKNKCLIQFKQKCSELDRIDSLPNNLGFFADKCYFQLFMDFYKNYFTARNKIIHSTSYSVSGNSIEIKWIDKNTSKKESKNIKISAIDKLVISLLLAYQSIGSKTSNDHLLNKSIYYLGDFLYGEESNFKINKYWDLKLEKRMDDFISYDYEEIIKSLEEDRSNTVIKIEVETKIGKIYIYNEKIIENPKGIFLSAI